MAPTEIVGHRFGDLVEADAPSAAVTLLTEFRIERVQGGRRPDPRTEDHGGSSAGGIREVRRALAVPEVALVVHERERADPRPGVLLIDGRERSDAARQWRVADEEHHAPEPCTEGDQENEREQDDQGPLRPLEEEE